MVIVRLLSRSIFMPKLALIGDYRKEVIAHLAIPQALQLACEATGTKLGWEWIGTEKITDAPRDLADYDGVWCVPASPYKNMAGALAAIQYAREKRLPFLGTCGGFQHLLIEFARNAAQIDGAEHAESNPGAADLVVTKLVCSLVEQSGAVTFTPGSQLHGIFGGQPTRSEYHCSYGVNTAYRVRLESAGLRFTGFDDIGDIRAGEFPGHPFFIGTLFQPERSALQGRQHPLIQAFVRAMVQFSAEAGGG
jgi:CTP synthase (UTP-ammonia lyase)